jgi:hypothetical protein
MANLEELNLSGNQISDLTLLRGISTTAPSLTLDLRDNPITVAQVNELRATAGANVTVIHNAVGDDSPAITRHTEVAQCHACGMSKSWRITAMNNGGEITERRAAKWDSQGNLLAPCRYSYRT